MTDKNRNRLTAGNLLLLVLVSLSLLAITVLGCPSKQITIEVTPLETEDFVAPWPASPGYVFIWVRVSIENKGYDVFQANPEFFKLASNDIVYTITASNLKFRTVQDGDWTTGNLAFEVPDNVLSEGYELQYVGLSSYNIKWMYLQGN